VCECARVRVCVRVRERACVSLSVCVRGVCGRVSLTMCVCMCVRVCVSVWVSECVNLSVCVCERERVCMSERV